MFSCGNPFSTIYCHNSSAISWDDLFNSDFTNFSPADLAVRCSPSVLKFSARAIVISLSVAFAIVLFL